MNHTSSIRARCEPQLAERFALAAKVNGRSASAALRELMVLYVEQTTPRNDNGRPDEGTTIASVTHPDIHDDQSGRAEAQ
jgi:hypothetical protein